jgi:hypothetical protein
MSRPFWKGAVRGWLYANLLSPFFSIPLFIWGHYLLGCLLLVNGIMSAHEIWREHKRCS